MRFSKTHDTHWPAQPMTGGFLLTQTHEHTMFGPLTPAAERKAEEFRQALITSYVHAWEADGKNEVDSLSIEVLV